MPRKSSLDTRLLKKIVRRLRQQGFAKTAMKELGFSQSTYHKWRRRGEAEIARREQIVEELGPDGNLDFSDPVSTAEQIYVVFVQLTRRAQGRVERLCNENLIDHVVGRPAEYLRDTNGGLELDRWGKTILLHSEVKTNWKCAARLLEILDRETWARRTLPAFEPDEDDDTIPQQFEVHVVDKRTSPPAELEDDLTPR